MQEEDEEQPQCNKCATEHRQMGVNSSTGAISQEKAASPPVQWWSTMMVNESNAANHRHHQEQGAEALGLLNRPLCSSEGVRMERVGGK